jgi:sugar phosphate isomerase/epimerase
MTTRRQFLTTTAMTTTGILLNSLESFATPLTTSAAPGFSLTLLATNWGFEGSHEQFAAKAKAAGYDGVEVWIPGEEKDRAEFLQAMQKNNLKFGFLCGGGDKDPVKHLPQFQDGLNTALKTKPLYINCHSGRDYFSYEQNKKFIEWSYLASKDTGVPVYHETHRGRILYSAPLTKNYIDALPSLRLTLDISHWCAVHESFLEDQAETVALALSRTDHIHARIGHAEGPQVNDPRAPEWGYAVKAHFAWWDKIVERKKAEGIPLTILAEFGPADYMPTLPYTRQPVADQWAINVYMMEVLRKRYL